MKFSNLLRSIILEASRLEVLMDKFVKSNKKGDTLSPEEKASEGNKIPKEVFFELIKADPTSRLNNVELETASKNDLQRVKVGSYVPWLIKQYLNVSTERNVGERGYEQELKAARDLFMEDLFKVPDELMKFERFKGRLPAEQRDINKLSLNDLVVLMGEYKLEKTKGSKEEKKSAAQTFEYPGSEVVFRGSQWTVVKIEGCDRINKDAAIFFGGSMLKPEKGETSWCTSGPGLSYFENTYCKKGPLYVILPNTDTRYGEVSGLPANRYQIQFASDQFMDKFDHRFNFTEKLNGEMSELKEFFKPEFAKGLTSGDGESLNIEGFGRGVVGQFVGLYGLDELFENLPATLTEISISNPEKNNIIISIPPSIGKFKNLNNLSLSNCVSEVPKEVCELENLEFLGLMNNTQLTTIPDCIAFMDRLYFVNVDGSTNLKMPSAFQERWDQIDEGMWENTNEG